MQILGFFLTVAVASFSGCATSSHTSKGAGMGAMGGATIGAIAGGGSGQTAEGMAIGAVAGAAIGGIVGAMQDAKENKQQERIAQDRAYQQEIAKMREMEARSRAAREQELAIAEGMRITERELEDAMSRAQEAEGRLKELRNEVEGR